MNHGLPALTTTWATALTFSAFVAQAAPTLLINGDFEAYGKPPEAWTVPFVVDLSVAPGRTDLLGWSIVHGTIDYGLMGGRAVDLAGNPGSGGISQTFATEPGSRYRLRFDLSDNPDRTFGEPPLKTMRVSVADLVRDYEYDVQVHGNSFSDMRWETQELEFVATGTATTLQFISTLPVRFTGATLDNVSVTAVSNVAVPATLPLLLAGGFGLATLRAWRGSGSRTSTGPRG